MFSKFSFVLEKTVGKMAWKMVAKKVVLWERWFLLQNLHQGRDARHYVTLLPLCQVLRQVEQPQEARRHLQKENFCKCDPCSGHISQNT